jgi:hydroxyisourate hydrolase
MSGLTTHVLDTSRGRPADGVRIDFSQVAADGSIRLIRSVVTDRDGRARVVDDGDLRPGRFVLTFHVADYFRATSTGMTDPPFYDAIPVRFGVTELDRHYHVPLLVSPFGYATYRGS